MFEKQSFDRACKSLYIHINKDANLQTSAKSNFKLVILFTHSMGMGVRSDSSPSKKVCFAQWNAGFLLLW